MGDRGWKAVLLGGLNLSSLLIPSNVSILHTMGLKLLFCAAGSSQASGGQAGG